MDNPDNKYKKPLDISQYLLKHGFKIPLKYIRYLMNQICEQPTMHPELGIRIKSNASEPQKNIIVLPPLKTKESKQN